MDSEKFFKLYAKIPEAERNFTIVIIDGKEITWDAAYKEIRNKTKLGDKGVFNANKRRMGLLRISQDSDFSTLEMNG